MVLEVAPPDGDRLPRGAPERAAASYRNHERLLFIVRPEIAVATHLDEIDLGIDVDGLLFEVHVERIPETFHGMAVRVLGRDGVREVTVRIPGVESRSVYRFEGHERPVVQRQYHRQLLLSPGMLGKKHLHLRQPLNSA